ncbi:MAG: ABC transporter substrate-binding protein [Lachnospiraceae bacterium]|nr:ABC transporter substrate-binding protein [Lachnospiraceae bacterium]
MKKKLLAVALVAAMAMGLMACGGGSSSGSSDAAAGDAAKTEEAAAPAASGEGDIRLVNGKIEVDAALKAAAEAYKAETGVTVAIESMGGGVNIQDTLKGYFQADNMPDIFVCGSDADFGNWTGKLADLSNEPWAADTDAGYKDAEGKIIGFPYTTEAIGLAYNASILEKAGIDPASITGPESMKAAFETLDAKKDELGLTAVIGWCCEAKDLYWSTGSHSFANYIDAGLSRDDTTYSDLLAEGKIDEARFQKYAEMIALFNQYSDPALLTSGTYDQQILGFASGKYAFVTQGSWIGATMTSDDKEQYEAAGSFKVGMIPYAFDEGIDTILTNSPSWWAVFENDNTQKAKDFLTWLAGDEGQKFLVEDAGFISPFKSCKYVANDPFAQTITDFTAAGKTSSWHWLKNKASLDQNVLGQLYLDYALGSIPDAATFTQVVSQQVAAYYAQ